MSDSSRSDILLMGLSGTGKTNFLVALDVILDYPRDRNALVHSDHAADRAYVQPLREQWLRGEELTHTSRQTSPLPHQLLVNHPESDTRAAFFIPDLAGETFDEQFVSRSISAEFGHRLRTARGLILFLHCDHESDNDLHEFPQFSDEPSQSSSLSSATSWNIENSSKQVKLVDLLQFVGGLRGHPLKIAIAISAWDLVENASAEVVPRRPVNFLNKRWPLLAQYLLCNSQQFPSRTFGVSARGGGTTIEAVARLTSLIDVRDRLILVDGDHRSTDLTRPVRWLLGLLHEDGA